MEIPRLDDGLMDPEIKIWARQLLGLVCTKGGVICPLIAPDDAQDILDRLAKDPTVAIQLRSDAEELPHYTRLSPEQYAAESSEDVLNRKRDLDVLQKLGLLPGDVRRARYLFELLFKRIETPEGICAFDTPGWAGCPLARSGTYESVREKGWQAVVYQRGAEEMAEYRERNVEQIMTGEQLYMRPHHLMCMACWYAGGEGTGPRPNDTLSEILDRIRQEPDVPITLVEGACEACDCCDGFYPDTGRCVHAGGLIRDYKKDLDCFQKLGMMPGDTMNARELIDLMFERIPSTSDVCGYGDDVVTGEEWAICSGPGGNAGYEKTRVTGVF